MIRYRLRCKGGHAFDAWFSSSTAYDEEERRGRLNCPICQSPEVEKALMSPRIAASSVGQSEPQPQSAASGPAAAGEPGDRMRALMSEMRRLRDAVRDQSEYVGPRFAEEARRIYFEEAPERSIYGEATRQDVEKLGEEGIDVFQMPNLPDDLN